MKCFIILMCLKEVKTLYSEVWTSDVIIHHRRPADPHVSTRSAGLREPEKHGQLMAVRKAQIGWMSLSCECLASASGDKHTRRWQKHQKRVSFESRTAAGSNCSPFRRQADLFRLISSFNELLLEFREKQRFKAAGDVWLSLCFIAVSAQCLQTQTHLQQTQRGLHKHAHTYNTVLFIYTVKNPKTPKCSQWYRDSASIHYSSGTVRR